MWFHTVTFCDSLSVGLKKSYINIKSVPQISFALIFLIDLGQYHAMIVISLTTDVIFMGNFPVVLNPLFCEESCLILPVSDMRTEQNRTDMRIYSNCLQSMEQNDVGGIS